MDGVSYEEILEALSDVRVPIIGQASSNGRAASASPREILRNYRAIIPRVITAKLAASKPSGDRSKVLWKLNCALLEAGLTPGEVVALVEKTVWNKFGEDRSRLWADVNKAARRVSQSPSDPSRNGASRKSKNRTEPWSIPLDRYLAVESRDPQWMIEGLWTDKSHGIIAGEPKTRKSYLAIDIALSVATGTPCFGHFPVHKSGPVLLIQEEISDAEMKKRLRHIAHAKKLSGTVKKTPEGISVRLPDPIPLYLRNRQQFELGNVEHLEKLTEEILEKSIRLVIFDPLQMMLGGVNEDKASEVRPILIDLLKLKEATGCGVMIVHHYGKNEERKGGQRMLGSQAFHGWVESALYLTKPEPYTTRIEREFRNFEPMDHIDVEYLGGNDGYAVAIETHRPRRTRPNEFEQFCLKHLNYPVKAFAKHFRTTDKTIRRRIEQSPHLSIKSIKRKATGRPIDVVVRAEKDDK